MRNLSLHRRDSCLRRNDDQKQFRIWQEEEEEEEEEVCYIHQSLMAEDFRIIFVTFLNRIDCVGGILGVKHENAGTGTRWDDCVPAMGNFVLGRWHWPSYQRYGWSYAHWVWVRNFEILSYYHPLRYPIDLPLDEVSQEVTPPPTHKAPTLSPSRTGKGGAFAFLIFWNQIYIFTNPSSSASLNFDR